MTDDHPLRDIEIPFGGKTFTVRPEFAVIASIEEALDQSCRELGLRCIGAYMGAAFRKERGIEKQIALRELSVICFYALRGQPDAPKSIQEAGGALMEYGYDSALAPIANFLGRAKVGHKEHEREAKLMAEREEREKREAEAGSAASDPPNSQSAA